MVNFTLPPNVISQVTLMFISLMWQNASAWKGYLQVSGVEYIKGNASNFNYV
jgi:hypothetical protein